MRNAAKEDADGEEDGEEDALDETLEAIDGFLTKSLSYDHHRNQAAKTLGNSTVVTLESFFSGLFGLALSPADPESSISPGNELLFSDDGSSFLFILLFLWLLRRSWKRRQALAAEGVGKKTDVGTTTGDEDLASVLGTKQKGGGGGGVEGGPRGVVSTANAFSSISLGLGKGGGEIELKACCTKGNVFLV